MGGIVSTGLNNDDLIDNLLEVDYIKTSIVERVFRAVDRAEYFLPDARVNAYKDVAWKCGNLHLSAPCIYSEVMEGLCLEPGLSFLNLGSGTGYLNTMIGLILGENGINHGIEFYEDVVQYANKKIEEFKKYSGAIDEFNFCQPIFLTGNCLCLSESHQYDRVYCGASCPPAFEQYMKNLLKIGGILVVPINEHLMQFKRVSETVWNSKTLLPVSFASLIQPLDENHEAVMPIEIHPQSLQALSRVAIRNILRRNVELELPPAPTTKRVLKKTPRKKRVLKRFIVPLFEDDSSDDDIQVTAQRRNNGPRVRATFNNDYENFFSHVIDTFRFRSTAPKNAATERSETEPVNENQDIVQGDEEDESEDDAGVAMDVSAEKTDTDVAEIDNANASSVSMIANDGSSCSEDHKIDSNTMNSDSSEIFRTKEPNKTTERKKIDSGICDDNDIFEVSETEDNEKNETDDLDRSYLSTASDEDQSKRAKRTSRVMNSNRPKWPRIALEPTFSSNSDSDNETEINSHGDNSLEMRMYESRYTLPMKNKIQRLPLPQILKNYLNFHRDF